MKKLVLLITGITCLTLNDQCQTVTDYDGNVYDTVVIGSLAWFKENLRVTHYSNGDPIPNVKDNAEWASLTTGARCYYDNDSIANDSVYGPLYNWHAVNNASNICPSGWHVSTNAEWNETEIFLGGAGIAGGKMKEAGTVHWLSPNTGATNSSGFTGLPGGMRDPANNFRTLHENGLWWTATTYSSMAWSTYLWYLFTGVDHNPTPKNYGFSIRCVKEVTTSLGNIDHTGNIKFYPNPSGSRIRIECEPCQGKDLQVYTLLGKMVMERILPESSSEVDIGSLPAGAYILRIAGDKEIMQGKIIKE